MSIPCDMIRDLADKCESGEASAETRAAVESHLEGCESCRRYYESRRAAVISAPHLRVEAGGADEALIAESLRNSRDRSFRAAVRRYQRLQKRRKQKVNGFSMQSAAPLPGSCILHLIFLFINHDIGG